MAGPNGGKPSRSSDAASSPRPEVTVHVWDHTPGAGVIGLHVKSGAGALSSIDYQWIQFRPDGTPFAGDGAAWIPALTWGLTATFDVFDPYTTEHKPDRRWNVERIALRPNYELVLRIGWQRPIVTWRRKNVVVHWSTQAQRENRQPSILRGRDAKRLFADADGRSYAK
ncbi:hypothetical protein [Microbacterium sp.]|uniref:hypothetical protein n=1 Tax=Microbacterium sp. TaxID=51671 RepID=UPI003A853181